MSGKFQSILLGGVIVGLLASLFGIFQVNVQSQMLGAVSCCAVPTIGAFVATWHYSSTNAITMPAGQGAVMGLSACILGYAISVVLSVLIAFTGLIPNPFDVDAIMEMTRDKMMESGTPSADIDRALGYIEKYFYLFTVIAVVAYGLLGAVAGAIGANVFKRGQSAETV